MKHHSAVPTSTRAATPTSTPAATSDAPDGLTPLNGYKSSRIDALLQSGELERIVSSALAEKTIEPARCAAVVRAASGLIEHLGHPQRYASLLGLFSVFNRCFTRDIGRDISRNTSRNKGNT